MTRNIANDVDEPSLTDEQRKGAATGKDERAASTAQFPLFPLFGKIRERQSRPTATLRRPAVSVYLHLEKAEK